MSLSRGLISLIRKLKAGEKGSGTASWRLGPSRLELVCLARRAGAPGQAQVWLNVF